MSSVITHMGVGVVIAEILLRIWETDPDCVIKNRLWFWLFGAFGGLVPDLDVVPAIITGEMMWTYHHIYTHTLLAVGIMVVITAAMRFKPLPSTVLAGFVAHLILDFFDNSILPFSPFDQVTEWGLHISDWFVANGWYFELDLIFFTFTTTYLEFGLTLMSFSLIPIALYLLKRTWESDIQASCAVNLGK